jgi:hypothetical protein
MGRFDNVDGSFLALGAVALVGLGSAVASKRGSSAKDYDALVFDHFQAKVDPQLRKLIAQAKYDLFYGPHTEEGYPGWDSAIRQIGNRVQLGDVWVDTQADLVLESEPEAYEQDGQWIEPEWGDYIHFDSVAVKKAVLGELAPYV